MASEPSHVPAWKKLGLKLKYAEEEAPELRNEDREPREQEQDLKGPDDVVKKAEKEERKDKKNKKKRRLDEEEEGKGDSVAAEDESAKKKKQKKEKKVSFAAETKVEDADGDKGAKGEKESGDSMSNGEDGDGEMTQEDTQKEEKRNRMKEKKEKRKQGEKQPGAAPANIHEAPILSYLNLYYQHRPAWKFQKNRETQLFKHVLEPEHVPTEYNAALLAYLQGLKGEAARQRLSQTAGEIVKTEMEEQSAQENEEKLEDAGDQSVPDMDDYYKAIEEFRKRLMQGNENLNDVNALGQQRLDGDMRKRLEKRLRADLMFFAINGKVFYLQKSKAPQKGKSQQNGAQAETPATKKKNRTAVVDISSSSESDSDSDSDDDKAPQKGKSTKQQSNEEKLQAPAKKKKNRTAVVDISSSSESDSSSSDSDSDSENNKDKKAAKSKRDESSDDSSSDSSSDSNSDDSSSSDSS